jgi:hypothetical protein
VLIITLRRTVVCGVTIDTPRVRDDLGCFAKKGKRPRAPVLDCIECRDRSQLVAVLCR